MGVGGQHNAPAALPPGMTRVGLMAGLDRGGENTLNLPGFKPLIVKGAVSHFID
jgi:hypothetical protein